MTTLSLHPKLRQTSLGQRRADSLPRAECGTRLKESACREFLGALVQTRLFRHQLVSLPFRPQSELTLRQVVATTASEAATSGCCFWRPRENDNVVNIPLTTLSFAHYHNVALFDRPSPSRRRGLLVGYVGGVEPDPRNVAPHHKNKLGHTEMDELLDLFEAVRTATAACITKRQPAPALDV